MNKKHEKVLFVLLLLGVGLFAYLAYVILFDRNFALLNPKGTIAEEQRDLMNIAGMLSLLVILPVFVLTFYIARKYRAGNTKAKHAPDWDHNTLLESIWWGVPFVIIAVLAVITWNSSHDLDPYKKLSSSTKPVTIQVVALDWKWLFIYPDQSIASVNYVQFPEKTPVNFEITADAPMNSFWIPQLGGQIYAMAGMETKLHLMADSIGTYRGSSANISGEGFAGMVFKARSTSKADFDTWVKKVRDTSKQQLTPATYDTLAEPTRNDPVTTYASVTRGLHDTIIDKYMGHGHHGGEH